jgi:hypothetical protein
VKARPRWVAYLLRAVSLLGLLGAAAVGVEGCREAPTGSAPSTTEGPEIRITFVGSPGTPLEAAGVHVAGNVSTSTELASTHGGRLVARTVDAPGVETVAAEFPALDAAPGAPASAVLVRSVGTDDRLDPGTRDFAFGADVQLAETSESAVVGSSDNGNNVVQKGLYLDSSQYKLQIDHGFASCRVAGSEGDLSVKSQVRIEPGEWYRLACARSEDGVTISIAELDSADGEALDRQVVHGDSGNVDILERSRYLSVGAKIQADGTIPTSTTDQFNGLIAAVFVEIHGYE